MLWLLLIIPILAIILWLMLSVRPRIKEKRQEARRKEDLKQVRDGMQRIIAAQEMIDNAGLYLTGQLSDEDFAKIKEKHLGKE